MVTLNKEYIEDRVETVPESGCWIWMRSTTGVGYGDFRIKSGHYLAHRATYELWHGAIPEGMHVCHRCDVRACVNPDHLFLGTNQDNILDSVKKGRRKGITRNRPSGLVYAKSARMCVCCGKIFSGIASAKHCGPACYYRANIEKWSRKNKCYAYSLVSTA